MIIPYIQYIKDFKRLLRYTNYFDILKLFLIDLIFNNSIVKNYYKNNFVEIRINNFKILYHKKNISNVIAMISEEEYFDFIKKQIYNVVIDIGAYAGLFSILMSNFSRKVFAIEANPINYKILTMNISKNKLRNIIPINSYISDYNGFSYVYAKQCDPWSITINASASDTYDVRGKVEVKTLDKLAEEFNLTKIDLVKIDVDGEEISVINGSKKLLLNGIIDEIIIEIHKQEFLQILINFFVKYGYKYLLKRSAFSKDLFYMYAKRSQINLWY